MKKYRAHDIPLCRQTTTILEDLHQYRYSRYVFPSGTKTGHMTAEGISKALHCAGIPKGEMTLHGFRKVWGTLAREAMIPEKLVEKQLAHLVGDATSRAYDRAEYLEVRRYLMQWWADYLDALRDALPLPQVDFTIINKYA